MGNRDNVCPMRQYARSRDARACVASAASGGPSYDTVKCSLRLCCIRLCSVASRRQRASISVLRRSLGLLATTVSSVRIAPKRLPSRYCTRPSSTRASVSSGSSRSAWSSASLASASRRSRYAAAPAPRCSRAFFGSITRARSNASAAARASPAASALHPSCSSIPDCGLSWAETDVTAQARSSRHPSRVRRPHRGGFIEQPGAFHYTCESYQPSCSVSSER